jgi:hypothetical protein
MIVDDGKEKIIALIDTNLTQGSLGTSSQTPTVDDTDLIAEATSTINTISGVQSAKQLRETYNINSVTGNGNTYTEYGNKFSDGTLLNRITFTGVPKNESTELEVITIINQV